MILHHIEPEHQQHLQGRVQQTCHIPKHVMLLVVNDLQHKQQAVLHLCATHVPFCFMLQPASADAAGPCVATAAAIGRASTWAARVVDAGSTVTAATAVVAC